MNRATRSINTVKRRAATRPIRIAATREKTKTVIVNTTKRTSGPPESAMFVRRKAYSGVRCESTAIF